MASVKVKFRPSTIDGKEGSIYYQVIHNRVVRQIRTDYRIFESEWNGKTSSVSLPIIVSTERRNYLELVISRIEWDIKCLKAIITLYDKRDGSYTTGDIVTKFNCNSQDLF